MFDMRVDLSLARVAMSVVTIANVRYPFLLTMEWVVKKRPCADAKSTENIETVENQEMRKPRDSSSMDVTLAPNEMLKVRSELADVKSILIELRDQMKEIIKSQQFLSAQYDEIKGGH
ncbi:hypothetical protein QE152_g936 [Popillia japonica]|uniref:Uncharacterized protein n=1 Tax=Popillia japonica TaxID=7064 RepID=A0AAW1N7B1_POPJA